MNFSSPKPWVDQKVKHHLDVRSLDSPKGIPRARTQTQEPPVSSFDSQPVHPISLIFYFSIMPLSLSMAQKGNESVGQFLKYTYQSFFFFFFNVTALEEWFIDYCLHSPHSHATSSCITAERFVSIINYYLLLSLFDNSAQSLETSEFISKVRCLNQKNRMTTSFWQFLALQALIFQGAVLHSGYKSLEKK